MESVTVTIDVPPRVLSPNGRCHWAKKSKARREQRDGAKLAAWTHNRLDKWESATVKVLWFAKTANGLRMDADNIIGSLKGAIDGLVDAGLLADDRGLIWLPPKVDVDKKAPRVELVVTRAEAA